MTWTALFFGFALFFAGCLVHIVLWRVKRPRDDFRGLAVCLLVLPGAGGILICLAGLLPAVTLRETLAGMAVTVALGASYIMYYPAAQAASPTMLVVIKIGRAGRTGITRAQLLKAFDDGLLCRQSIENLVHERFADERDGKLVVAPRGVFLLRMLGSWRGFLGLKQGEG
jgi:hypothetical protein